MENKNVEYLKNIINKVDLISKLKDTFPKGRRHISLNMHNVYKNELFDYKGNLNIQPKGQMIQALFSTYNEKKKKPKINNIWIALSFLPMPP